MRASKKTPAEAGVGLAGAGLYLHAQWEEGCALRQGGAMIVNPLLVRYSTIAIFLSRFGDAPKLFQLQTASPRSLHSDTPGQTDWPLDARSPEETCKGFPYKETRVPPDRRNSIPRTSSNRGMRRLREVDPSGPFAVLTILNFPSLSSQFLILGQRVKAGIDLPGKRRSERESGIR